MIATLSQSIAGTVLDAPERTPMIEFDISPPASHAPGGESIGFLDGDQQVALRPGEGRGWMTITLDTPVRTPVDFAAKGATERMLETCGI